MGSPTWSELEGHRVRVERGTVGNSQTECRHGLGTRSQSETWVWPFADEIAVDDGELDGKSGRGWQDRSLERNRRNLVGHGEVDLGINRHSGAWPHRPEDRPTA